MQSCTNHRLFLAFRRYLYVPLTVEGADGVLPHFLTHESVDDRVNGGGCEDE